MYISIPKINLLKVSASLCFIVRIFQDALSSECQIHLYCFACGCHFYVAIRCPKSL